MTESESDCSDRSCEVYPNLNKFWGISEYDTDHYTVLVQREKNRVSFYYKSPQIEHRSTLVEWMKKIAALKKLDNSSIHLAVYLLDVFMDNHHIVIERLYLVALVCLLLATKFEERDIKSLKAHDLNKLIENKYPLSDYFTLEIIVLKHCSWNLFLPTSVEFVNYYIGYMLTEEDSGSIKENHCTDVWYLAKSTVHIYLDCVITDIGLMQEKPSLVAAAIIAITRLELGLSKIWPEQIIMVTGYKLQQLKNIVVKLRKVFLRRK